MGCLDSIKIVEGTVLCFDLDQPPPRPWRRLRHLKEVQVLVHNGRECELKPAGYWMYGDIKDANETSP